MCSIRSHGSNPGISLQQAQQEMDSSVFARIATTRCSKQANRQMLSRLPAELVHPGTRTALWMLFGAVLFLLLIACAMSPLFCLPVRARTNERAPPCGFGRQPRKPDPIADAGVPAFILFLGFTGVWYWLRLQFPRSGHRPHRNQRLRRGSS